MKQRFYFLLLLTLLLKSCEVPDVQPFIKATSALGTTIEGGLKQVAANLKNVSIPNATDTEPEERKQAVKLRQNRLEQAKADLDARTAAFSKVAQSFNDYANALHAVVIRGEKTAQSISKVSSTLNTLLKNAADFATIPGGKLPSAAVTFIAEVAKEINTAKTIHKLSELASPAQDTLVQRTARVLRLGLQKFGSVDSAAYLLRYNNKPKYDEMLQDLYQNDFDRQQAAIEPLRLISILHAYLVNPRLEMISGRLNELSKIDARYNSRLIEEANKSWSSLLNKQGAIEAKPDAVQKAVAQLDAALTTREAYYRGWLVSQELTSLYEAEQARYPAYNGQWLAKSQQAIGDWATAHHVLRTALIKSKKLGASDLLRYEQTTKTFVDAVREAKK